MNEDMKTQADKKKCFQDTHSSFFFFHFFGVDYSAHRLTVVIRRERLTRKMEAQENEGEKIALVEAERERERERLRDTDKDREERDFAGSSISPPHPLSQSLRLLGLHKWRPRSSLLRQIERHVSR